MVGLHGRVQILEYVKEFEPESGNGLKFFYFWVLYSYLVPIAMYFTLDIIQIIHTVQLTHKDKKSYCKIYESIPLSSLGLIDYAIIDTEGVITKNEQEVRSIYIRDQLFEVDAKELSVKLHSPDYLKNLQERKETVQRPPATKRLEAEEVKQQEGHGKGTRFPSVSDKSMGGLAIGAESSDRIMSSVPEEGTKSKPVVETKFKHSIYNLNIDTNRTPLKPEFEDPQGQLQEDYEHSPMLADMPLQISEPQVEENSYAVTHIYQCKGLIYLTLGRESSSGTEP